VISGAVRNVDAAAGPDRRSRGRDPSGRTLRPLRHVSTTESSLVHLWSRFEGGCEAARSSVPLLERILMSKRLSALVASTVIATSLIAAPSFATASSSHVVKSAQVALNKEGANLSADGKEGPKTHAAIAAYQRARGLKVTGHLDKPTRAALKIG